MDSNENDDNHLIPEFVNISGERQCPLNQTVSD